MLFEGHLQLFILGSFRHFWQCREYLLFREIDVFQGVVVKQLSASFLGSLASYLRFYESTSSGARANGCFKSLFLLWRAGAFVHRGDGAAGVPVALEHPVASRYHLARAA
jgi:hypothetical protein